MSTAAKTILISGGTSGIGRATVLYFLQHGWQVVSWGRRDALIDTLKVESEGLPGTLKAFTWDLASRDWDAFLQMLADASIHRVDALINNAGYLVKKPFLELTAADIDASYTINSVAPLELIQKVVPMMPKDSFILNVSTMGGVQGSVKFPELSAYASSKSAVIALSELLAVELEPMGIYVNALALGGVDTEMLQAAFPGIQVNTRPEDVAKYIFSWVTDHGNLFNGKTLQLSSSTP